MFVAGLDEQHEAKRGGAAVAVVVAGEGGISAIH